MRWRLRSSTLLRPPCRRSSKGWKPPWGGRGARTRWQRRLLSCVRRPPRTSPASCWSSTAAAVSGRRSTPEPGRPLASGGSWSDPDHAGAGGRNAAEDGDYEDDVAKAAHHRYSGQDVADDQAGQRQAVAVLAGLADLFAGDVAEDDADRREHQRQHQGQDRHGVGAPLWW